MPIAIERDASPFRLVPAGAARASHAMRKKRASPVMKSNRYAVRTYTIQSGGRRVAGRPQVGSIVPEADNRAPTKKRSTR
ncbi:MAG TPA: hypothetical protein VFK04_16190 [Gemmatimonadaceae bacterium]|nr:hypothetical protein [Gemmatimonadaceae bacterium]